MSFNLRSITITKKLVLLLVISLVGITIFGLTAFQTINTVTVNGPIYDQIVQGKDLVADILPPPLYIIESYLLVHQMLGKTDPQELNKMADYSKQLQKDYDTRLDYWKLNLEDGEIKELLIKASSIPAKDFFKAFNDQFLPSLLAEIKVPPTISPKRCLYPNIRITEIRSI